MRKFLLVILFLFVSAGSFLLKGTEPVESSMPYSYQLYMDMGLENVVNYTAFEQAIDGRNYVNTRRKDIITLIDFTKPSNEKRLYVFDLDNRKMLFCSVVAHGRNSGDKYATSFSNVSGSKKSSLGFYLTGGTYNGDNGYSLRLNGLEKGINDRALERSIVIHAADYCKPSFLASCGRLGRSLGCPALPPSVNKDIIDVIKDGTLLYIYAEDKNYLSHSTFLSQNTTISTLL